MIKIISIVLSLLIVLTISWVVNLPPKIEAAEAKEIGRFKLDSSNDIGPLNGCVIIDTKTGVNYLFVRGLTYGGGLTVLVDSNGNPIISEVENEK